MPKLEFFVISESVSIDQATYESSVFNILEEILTDNFPIIVPKCSALTLWRAEAGDADADWQSLLRIKSPGQDRMEFPINFRFPHQARRHRISQRFYGIPIMQEGDLEFELLLNGKHSAEHIVTVRLVPSSELPPRQV